jgi:hypothetical protein
MLHIKLSQQCPEKFSKVYLLLDITDGDFSVLQDWLKVTLGYQWGITIPAMTKTLEPSTATFEIRDLARIYLYNIGKHKYAYDCSIFKLYGVERS